MDLKNSTLSELIALLEALQTICISNQNANTGLRQQAEAVVLKEILARA